MHLTSCNQLQPHGLHHGRDDKGAQLQPDAADQEQDALSDEQRPWPALTEAMLGELHAELVQRKGGHDNEQASACYPTPAANI